MTVYHRLLPSPVVGNQTKVANGRSYSAAVGSYLDVPNFDAGVLEAAQWTFVAQSGPTSARPTPSLVPIGAEGVQSGPGCRYYDTTLSEMIFCDGVTWRNAAGTAV